MEQPLYELLHHCTVQIAISGKVGHGTGFFVAPGLLLTCAHVIPELLSETITIEIPEHSQQYSASIIWREEKDDLAALHVHLIDHPCVYLHEDLPLLHERLYSYGYPDNLPRGDTLTVEYEGCTHSPELLKFKAGQVRPGFSGAPLLNERTGMICGIISKTRGRESDLGGRAIPIATVLQVHPEIAELQQQFHRYDQRWRMCLDKTVRSLPHVSHVTLNNRPQNHIPLPRNVLFQPRPGEFEQLEAMLFHAENEQQPRRIGLVGMVGMGGIGKTQLAIQLAYRYEAHFPAGVFWMAATGLDILAWQRHLAELALRTAYLPPNDDPPSAENEYRRACYFCRYLAQHPDALLILDNVEEPDLLLTALPELAGREMACTMLYTSRNQSLLPGVTLHSVQRLPEQAAWHLLLETTRPSLLDEILVGSTQPEPWSARAMCQIVDYLPLALMHLRGLLARDQHLTLGTLLERLRERGALDIAKKSYGDAAPLSTIFSLSWEKVDNVDASRLFKLASYFPEAIPIPLWLLGLAGDAGENAAILEPLGKARVLLQELSLFEEMSDDYVRLHPLLREFGRRLVQAEDDHGKVLLAEASERLISEFANLSKVEERTRHTSYRHCLEQVRAAHEYTVLLEAAQAVQIECIERWMERESYLLEDEKLWPKPLPGLFYQQLYNRAIEEDFPSRGTAPAHWIRLLKRAGTDDSFMLKVFRGHTAAIRSVAFSPDSLQMLTGSFDGTVRIWELSKRILLATLPHTSGVTSVAFSPDGSWILTGSLDGTVRIWKRLSRTLYATLEGHTSTVPSVAFSLDGTQILTGSLDGTACLWKSASGELLHRLREHDTCNTGVTRVAFSPNGLQVLTGSSDGMVRLWENASGKLLRKWSVLGSPVTGITFSPDGKYLLSSTYGGSKVWECATEKLMVSMEGHTEEVLCVACSPDGSQALTGSDDKTARLWNVPGGELLTILEGHMRSVWSVAFSPDGNYMLTGSEDQTARLWKAYRGKSSTAGEGHTGRVSSMAFSPDGSLLLSGAWDHTVRLWEQSTGKLLTTLHFPGGSSRITNSVAFSPDGTSFIIGSEDKTATVWETKSGTILTTLQHQSAVQSVAFSPDGTHVLTASGVIRLWESSGGEPIMTLEGASTVGFSLDGHLLFGVMNQGIHIWERSSGTLLLTLEYLCPGDQGFERRVAFSPNGRALLAIGTKGCVYLWSIHDKQLLRVLQVPAEEVMHVSFSPNGELMTTCDARGRIFFWRYASDAQDAFIGMYVAPSEIGALYWVDDDEVILADKGGGQGRPHFHKLKLEGNAIRL